MVKRSNKAHNKGCYRAAGVAGLIRAWWSRSQSDKSNWADKRQQVQSDQAFLAYQKHLQLPLQDWCEKHAQQNAANYHCGQLQCWRHGFWPTGWSPGHNGLSIPPEVKSSPCLTLILKQLSLWRPPQVPGSHFASIFPEAGSKAAFCPSASEVNPPRVTQQASPTTQQLHKTAFTEKENKQAIYYQEIKKSLRSSDCKQTQFAINITRASGMFQYKSSHMYMPYLCFQVNRVHSAFVFLN